MSLLLPSVCEDDQNYRLQTNLTRMIRARVVLFSRHCRAADHEVARLPSRPAGPMIETLDLIAPTIPSRFGLAREKLDIGTGDELLDAIPDLIRLATMLTPAVDHELADALRAALRLPSRREETLLGI